VPSLSACLKTLNLSMRRLRRGMPVTPETNEPPYADTQLLISLLGILIFPHERTPEALGELLDGYDGPIDEIIRVRYSAEPNGRVRLTADDGTSEIIDAKSVKNLPRLLRNSIAHFDTSRSTSMAGSAVSSSRTAP
jgi:hypothetical protein